jgi:alpha-tubulin suppressor-like RCC1 family protein
MILYEDGTAFTSYSLDKIVTDARDSSTYTNITDIGCGQYMHAYVTNSNELILYGQLTDRENSTKKFDLEAIMPGFTIKQVGGGITHLIFLAVNNTGETALYYFGKNSLGSTGLANNTSRNTPQLWHLPYFLKDKKIDMMACGGYHTMILSQGDVYGVGYDDNGELGGTPRGDFYIMFKLKTPEPMRYIACGFFFSAMISVTNNVYCCGSNQLDQLGIGTQQERACFRLHHLEQFSHHVSRIFLGSNHWYVLTRDGELYYSGESRPIEMHVGHVSSKYSSGEFVQCNVPKLNTGAMEIACGKHISVIYYSKDKRKLFSGGFVDGLYLIGSKSRMFTDLVIY